MFYILYIYLLSLIFIGLAHIDFSDPLYRNLYVTGAIAMQSNSSIISEIFLNFLKGEDEAEPKVKAKVWPRLLWAYLKANFLKLSQRNS